MTRYKNVNGVKVPLSTEELAVLEAQEAAYVVERDLEASDPINFPLKRWQFHAMVDMLGLRTSIDTAIEGIPDASARAVAKAKLTHSHLFHRDDPLVATLSASVGMSSADLDAAWLVAKDLS